MYNNKNWPILFNLNDSLIANFEEDKLILPQVLSQHEEKRNITYFFFLQIFLCQFQYVRILVAGCCCFYSCVLFLSRHKHKESKIQRSNILQLEIANYTQEVLNSRIILKSLADIQVSSNDTRSNIIKQTGNILTLRYTSKSS